MRIAILVVSLLSSAALAYGDNPATTPGVVTPVVVVASQATNVCVTANAAAGAQATVTIPAVPGQFFYATLVESSYSAIAAPVATLMTTTSTNLTASFSIQQAMQAAVGENRVIYTFPAAPLKSTTVGTATTLVGNAGVAAISQSLKACGFYAP